MYSSIKYYFSSQQLKSIKRSYTMTRKYFDLLEELDSKLSYIADELEQERTNQQDDEDEEAVTDFIEEIEHLRGIIND